MVVLVKECGVENIKPYHEDGSYLNDLEHANDLFFADLDEEPKYRPYKDAEEFMEAQKEHGLYLFSTSSCCYKIVTGINYGSVAILWDSKQVEEISFKDLLARATWTDGSPCGVKED